MCLYSDYILFFPVTIRTSDTWSNKVSAMEVQKLKQKVCDLSFAVHYYSRISK